MKAVVLMTVLAELSHPSLFLAAESRICPDEQPTEALSQTYSKVQGNEGQWLYLRKTPHVCALSKDARPASQIAALSSDIRGTYLFGSG